MPVGRDQKQHVEVTRDLAEKMNRLFGPLFKHARGEHPADVATIPGLDGQKMSKSYGNTIGLFEEEKALRKKIMGIVTDSTPVEAPKDPDELEHRRALPAGRFAGGGRRDGGGISRRRRRLRRFQEAAFRRDLGFLRADARTPRGAGSDPAYVEQVLTECGRRARDLAEETMAKARLAAGLR